MAHRGPFGHIGPHKRGRSLNAYERARPNQKSRDIYEGLNKDPTETITKLSLDIQAPGQNLQPKNLTYLGSYTWTEATVPNIIVPG